MTSHAQGCTDKDTYSICLQPDWVWGALGAGMQEVESSVTFTVGVLGVAGAAAGELLDGFEFLMDTMSDLQDARLCDAANRTVQMTLVLAASPQEDPEDCSDLLAASVRFVEEHQVHMCIHTNGPLRCFEAHTGRSAVQRCDHATGYRNSFFLGT